MKSELLAKSPMLALPLMALFIFMAVFAAMFFLTMKKRALAYDAVARMPLDDDMPETPDTDDTQRGERR